VVAWLGQRNGPASLRLALGAVVAVLMILNSIGVYGFLSRAHIEHALAGDLTVASKPAAVEAHLDARQAELDDLKASYHPARPDPDGRHQGPHQDHDHRRSGFGAREARP
jgi:hypothetical protein